MASQFLYLEFFKNLLTGHFPSLETAEVRVALLEETYTFSNTHKDWGDVKNHESSGDGYTPGGVIIENRFVDIKWGDTIELDTTLTPKETTFGDHLRTTANFAVIYYNGGSSDSEKLLISCVIFDQKEAALNDEFKLLWDTGIIGVWLG